MAARSTPSPETPATCRIDVYSILDTLHRDDVATTLLAMREDAGKASALVTLTRVDRALAAQPEVRVSFNERAALAKHVHHPCFLAPSRVFVESGDLYVEAAHVAGWRLLEILHLCRIHHRPLPQHVALRLFLDVSEALLALASSELGLAHGDVGASTIVVTALGGAALVHSGMTVARPGAAGSNRRLAYKAPEQLREGLVVAEATHEADVWAFGVSLREALTGVHPFHGESDEDEAARVVRGACPSFSKIASPKLPPGVVSVVERAMRIDPTERYRDIASLHRELSAAVSTAAATHAEGEAFLEMWVRKAPDTPAIDSVEVLPASDDVEVAPAPAAPPPAAEAPPAARSPEPIGEPDDDDRPDEPEKLGRWDSIALRTILFFPLLLIPLVVYAIRSEKPGPTTRAIPSGSHAGAHSALASAAPPPPLVCSAKQADCNMRRDDGCETKLETDAKHCGSCARDCLGGTCAAGHCSPTTIATKQARASAVAADGTHAFWIAGDSIISAPLSGGPTKVLASNVDSPLELAVDAKDVYWTSGAGSVRAVAKSGGTPRTIADGQRSPSALVVDDDGVYWTNNTPGGAVVHAPLTGGAAVTVANGVDMPCGVAVFGDDVFYTSYGAGTVSHVPKKGGTPTVLASAQSYPCAIAVSSKGVFWLNVGTPSAVMRVPTAGGTPTRIAALSGHPAVSLALDDDHVYWTSANRNAPLLALSIADDAKGEPKPLVASLSSGAGIAAVHGVLVFADFGGDSIGKIVVGENAPMMMHDMGDMMHDAPPASASASASAAPDPAVGGDVVEIAIASVGNTMAFDKTELTVKTGQKVHLTFKNVATMAVLKHNWVVVKPGTEAKVAEEGLAAGEAASYVVAGDNVIASTKLAAGGETVEVTFTAPEAGTYPFICTMPGHYVVMKGKLVVTP